MVVWHLVAALMAVRQSTFADKGLNKIPDTVTDRQALLVGDVLATGYWAAKISEITEDDTVLIIGAGSTGICMLLCVLLKNPKRIIVCEKDENRIKFVNEHYPDVLTVVIARKRYEIQRLSKDQLFIQGIISKKEYDALMTNYSCGTYFQTVEKINTFWNDDIVDYAECVKFLKMNMFMSGRIISLFDNQKRIVANTEETIRDDLDRLYFEEVERFSEKFLLWEMQQAEEMQKYYDEHPEEYEREMAEREAAWEAIENQTPTKRVLLSISEHIFGFVWGDTPLQKLLQQINPDDAEVKSFFKEDSVKKELKKNRKIRRLITSQFGKKYLSNVWK